MKTIYKYPLTPTLLLPQDAVILKADMQLGNMYIWALVNPNEIFKEERKFECLDSHVEGYVSYVLRLIIENRKCGLCLQKNKPII